MFFPELREVAGLIEDGDLNTKTRRLLDSYNEGLRNGLLWPDLWESHGKPGGPWVSDSQSQLENDLWRRGWETGHDLKLASNRFNELQDYLMAQGGRLNA